MLLKKNIKVYNMIINKIYNVINIVIYIY